MSSQSDSLFSFPMVSENNTQKATLVEKAKKKIQEQKPTYKYMLGVVVAWKDKGVEGSGVQGHL